MSLLLKLLNLIPGLLALIHAQESARVAELERQVAAWKKDALANGQQVARLSSALKQLDIERQHSQHDYLIETQKLIDLQAQYSRQSIELAEKREVIARLSDAGVAGLL